MTAYTHPIPDDTPAKPHRSWLDRLGIGASFACAIHCMAAPFLLLLLPAAGTVCAHPAVHWALAVLVLPLALWVIFSGYRKHNKRHTLVLAGIGSALIVAGLILPMAGASSGFTATLPALPGGGGAMLADATGVGATACTETCCPSVAQAGSGMITLNFPPGGLVTMLGSVLLVAGHATNLRACRCRASHAGFATHP